MIFDDSLPEFVPGSSASHLTNKYAPNGLPSMSTVISDPMAPSSRMTGPTRTWKLQSLSESSTRVWALADRDEMMQEPSFVDFQGEEYLIPDSIPDELWQNHFRQNDAELNDRKETEFLLQLYKQTSGRWPVIYDRWQSHPVYGLRGKSLESLKSKFNKVVMKLFEIDLLQHRRPLTSMERLHISQQLKFLPVFAMKYNEKNEFLRRVFLENGFKRPGQEYEKHVNEMLRVPTMAMKKKHQQLKPPPAPGPHLASSLVSTVQGELSTTEYARIKTVLESLGIQKSKATQTPTLAKLFATIEKEASVLLMMRDSLQRKKQELEILRTSGGAGVAGMRMRGGSGPSAQPAVNTSSQQQPSATMQGVSSAQSILISQHKRKR